MFAVLGAMKEEVATLRGQMAVEETTAQRGFTVFKGKYSGKDMLLVQTGMGRIRAERATQFVLEHYPLESMVSVGFAGALEKGLGVGDVIIWSTIYSGNEDGLKTGDACHSDAVLLSQAQIAMAGQPFRILEGSGVTVPRAITRPESKEALGREYSAEAVDMESYWIGKAAQDRGVHFLTVRAISDTVEEHLSFLEQLFTDCGELCKVRAVIYFLTRPWQIAKLFVLGRSARRAEKNLTLFVDRLIAQF